MHNQTKENYKKKYEKINLIWYKYKNMMLLKRIKIHNPTYSFPMHYFFFKFRNDIQFYSKLQVFYVKTVGALVRRGG